MATPPCAGRTLALLCTLLLSAALLTPASAQHRLAPAADAAPDLATQRTLIETTIRGVVSVMEAATFQDTGRIGDQLRAMALQLSAASRSLAPSDAAPALGAQAPGTTGVTRDDLARLQQLLEALSADLHALLEQLEAEADEANRDRLAPLAAQMDEATALVRDLQAQATEAGRLTPADGDRWLRPGRYDGDRHDDDRRDDDAWRDDDRRHRTDDDREEIRHEIRDRIRDEIRRSTSWRDDEDDEDDHRFGRHREGYVPATVGEFDARWPFAETALYRPIPAIRYNRVEGLVLGAALPALDWYDYSRSQLFGQLGYAFALDRWRYEAGLETRPGRGYVRDYGVKLGGLYRRNTATNDLWKSGWVENSLGAFFFETDAFDYYEVEGWSLYTVQHLTRGLQLSAGYRDDTYRSLDDRTGWSLFGGGTFRNNPAIDDGRMHSFVFAAEGGRVADLHDLPRGVAFRAEAELGQGLGGDFSFNRYLADGRAYLPLSRYSTLSFRLRGGLGEGDVPLQKQFTLGGVGSVRAYPQNAFYGTRMLLANVEYAVDDVALFDDVIDDLQLFGFFDAGWVNDAGTNAFRTDDVLPAAGFGIGLDDRHLRLELAWPLRDVGTGLEPSLWLRLNPTF